MQHKNDCLVCAKPLIYFACEKELECFMCGAVKTANAACEDGHFVCDACHSKGPFELILKECMVAEESNPIALANKLMADSRVKMHGPEHHFLVPAVLLTSYAIVIGNKQDLAANLTKAQQRSKNVLGGFCGFYGACGAGIGTGIFISIIKSVTPLSDDEWGNANKMTSKALDKISCSDGPRCCKRDTYIAIQEAVKFMSDTYNIQLPVNDRPICSFSKYNKECLGANCNFHTK